MRRWGKGAPARCSGGTRDHSGDTTPQAPNRDLPVPAPSRFALMAKAWMWVRFAVFMVYKPWVLRPWPTRILGLFILVGYPALFTYSVHSAAINPAETTGTIGVALDMLLCIGIGFYFRGIWNRGGNKVMGRTIYGATCSRCQTSVTSSRGSVDAYLDVCTHIATEHSGRDKIDIPGPYG